MAVIHVEMRSEALKRTVPFNAILPIEKFRGPYPTLYLLHGLKDNCSSWLTNTRIRMWAENSGLAVIMPSGENSFYLDIPVKDGCLGDFGEYVGKELVETAGEMFPLSRKREETYIGGLSMGGYGALRNGLKYHETFGKIAVLSGALHFYEYPRELVEKEGNTIGELMNFGSLDETVHTDRNPAWLIEQLDAEEIPNCYIACGLQDFLLEANRSIAGKLKAAGAQVTYEEGEGVHDWVFWDAYIQHVLAWLKYDGIRK